METKKFMREKELVMRMLQRLRLETERPLTDPNVEDETGADVLALLAERRVGIQVTELDTGDVRGRSRNAETKAARAAPGPYHRWGQSDQGKLVAAIERAIREKISKANKHGFPGIDDAWLLISCGVPERGAAVSTFVMTQWISADDLNRSTAEMLVASKYDAAFVHPNLKSEEALFSWRKKTGVWVKDVAPDQLPAYSFDELKEISKNPELLADPDAWLEAELRKSFQEFQEQGREK